jgi:hypothetical protein
MAYDENDRENNRMRCDKFQEFGAPPYHGALMLLGRIVNGADTDNTLYH